MNLRKSHVLGIMDIKAPVTSRHMFDGAKYHSKKQKENLSSKNRKGNLN